MFCDSFEQNVISEILSECYVIALNSKSKFEFKIRIWIHERRWFYYEHYAWFVLSNLDKMATRDLRSYFQLNQKRQQMQLLT